MKTRRHSTEDEFYIGYLPEAPTKTAVMIKRITGFLGVTVVALCCTLALSQRKFSKGIFEYGTLAEVRGVLSLDPVPHIVVANGSETHSLLLVGFGKMGAEQAIQIIEKNAGKKLQGQLISLKGTKIYNDGKGLLQITAGDNLGIKIEHAPFSVPAMIPMGKVRLTGEIVDPKCYFGVMKPGEGKPHRSCAIRCISGGIPPVLAIGGNPAEYFILTGKAINQAILPFVGEPITLEGDLQRYGDWKILHVDQENIRTLVKLKTADELLASGKQITLCGGMEE
jgi:hypothetical protein